MQLSQQKRQISAAVIATLGNQLTGCARRDPVDITGRSLQLIEVDEILATSLVVMRQQLQRDEVPDGGNGHSQVVGEHEIVGCRGDLRFDPARRKEQIDDDPASNT